MMPHLSEAQLDALLHSAPGALVDSHLVSCPACQQELASLQQAFATFRIAATNASRVYTPARPAIASSATRNGYFRPAMRPIWAVGLASVLAVTALVVPTLHKSGASGSNPPISTAGNAPAAVSDEALLKDIDADLSTSVPPSLQPLDTTTQTASEQTISSTSN
jgi:predicted anti-sigma-YlaC factor YlaD